MTPASFLAWRNRLALTQQQAAEALGCSTRIIRAWEAGQMHGASRAIPRHIELACWAIEHGAIARFPKITPA